MNEKNNTSTHYNQVYGKYSLGGGSVISNPDNVFSDLDIESYKTSMSRDIERAGISKDKFKNFEVLDVGTGRQAMAFHLLGAKKVCHYDISQLQVERMKQFIQSNSLQDKITTKCVDLVKFSPPISQFDLVYLHGIVQHFSHTGLGLRNCMSAVKKGGYLWLYFYRSGTFNHFVIYLLLDLIKNVDTSQREYYINSLISFSDDIKPNFFISGLMDNLFSTYSHLYTPKSYISFVQECGFDIIYSSKLDPLGRDVDHKYAHQSTILVCKKVMEKDISKCNVDILSPEKSINQLDTEMYSIDSHKEILQTINEYNSLKKTLYSDNIPKSFIMTIVFKLLRFVKNCDKNEYEKNHNFLQLTFKNSREIIEKEFNLH